MGAFFLFFFHFFLWERFSILKCDKMKGYNSLNGGKYLHCKSLLYFSLQIILKIFQK